MDLLKWFRGKRKEAKEREENGFKRFAPGQKEPGKYIKMVTSHSVRLQMGDHSVTAYYGFDSEIDRVRVVQGNALGLASCVTPLPNMKGRNYLLEVRYRSSIPYEFAVCDAVRLRKKYYATDVSMIPVPAGLVAELHNTYGKNSCPFLCVEV